MIIKLSYFTGPGCFQLKTTTKKRFGNLQPACQTHPLGFEASARSLFFPSPDFPLAPSGWFVCSRDCCVCNHGEPGHAGAHSAGEPTPRGVQCPRAELQPGAAADRRGGRTECGQVLRAGELRGQVR